MSHQSPIHSFIHSFIRWIAIALTWAEWKQPFVTAWKLGRLTKEERPERPFWQRCTLA